MSPPLEYQKHQVESVTLTHMREAACFIIDRLRDQGHTAYLAGGCVRDRLLGIEPKDYDVATDAPPEVVRRLFKQSQSVGESFGVVLVRHAGQSIEVATFRSEWGYHDGRRPDHVIFTDAEHDAQRRDFTINGLFEDPATDRIIDYVGGQADLKARILRAIGDANERFAEDYLRMLRAVRFACRFDFQLEPATAAAIRKHSGSLKKISRERIGQEVRAMLSPASAQRLDDLQLTAAILPPPEVSQACAGEVLVNLPGDADYPTKLAAWLIDRHGESRASGQLTHWRKALCLSNDERDAVRDALAAMARARQWPSLNVAQRKRLLACDGWSRAKPLLSNSDVLEPINDEARSLIAEGVAPLPMVSGDDLVAMGMKSGPRVGALLYEVYDAQLSGTFEDRGAAIAWVRQRMADEGPSR